jgi:preprotein translocase subunit YajC
LDSGQTASFYKADVQPLPETPQLEALKVGQRVEIVGSQTPGGHKGKKGQITRFVDAENPEVRLDTGQTASFYKADVQPLPEAPKLAALKVGQRVEIVGSLTPGGHKGKKGQITRFVDAENPEVRLDDGHTASFYKADVQALPDLAPLPAKSAALKVGSRVEIVGSLTPGGHKGKKGQITRFVDAENPEVRLDSGVTASFYKADVQEVPDTLTPPAPLAPAAPKPALKVGARVEIIGSMTPGGHKGKRGQITRFIDSAENPEVRLESGQTVSFYKSDVQALPEAPSPPAAAALKVGLRVEIVGSLTPGGHKGKEGQITRVVDAENPEVRLDDGVTASFYKADVQALPEDP